MNKNEAKKPTIDSALAKIAEGLQELIEARRLAAEELAPIMEPLMGRYQGSITPAQLE
jgi:hypothetical protein